MPLVILVEDHADTRLMYAEFLSSEFEVVQAGDGEEALRVMQTRVPDLVITDLALPVVNGFELVSPDARRSNSCGGPGDLPERIRR